MIAVEPWCAFTPKAIGHFRGQRPRNLFLMACLLRCLSTSIQHRSVSSIHPRPASSSREPHGSVVFIRVNILHGHLRLSPLFNGMREFTSLAASKPTAQKSDLSLDAQLAGTVSQPRPVVAAFIKKLWVNYTKECLMVAENLAYYQAATSKLSHPLLVARASYRRLAVNFSARTASVLFVLVCTMPRPPASCHARTFLGKSSIKMLPGAA